MRTILITVFQAVAVKNILRTDVIKALLARPDVRVVCLTRFPERAEHYQREMPHERIVYDAFYRVPEGAFERFFSFLKFHLIKTATTDLKRRMHREDSGGWLSYALGMFCNRIIAHKSLRRLSRFLDYRLVADSGFGVVLEKHRPDVVVLTHLFDDAEVSLLREAEKRGMPTISFINSWDKLTARCALRLLPDKLIVFNEMVREEAITHADMPRERITVCGIPQYDQYVTTAPVARETFCKKNGLDPKRAIILFAPLGSTFSDADWGMIDALHALVADERLVPNAELFVRFQPNDYFDERELAARPWMKYAYPGIRYGTVRGGDWDMDFAELANLTDTLAHISLLICYASSMSVDAAVFDKPVINIDFELKPARRMSKSPTQFYRMEHYQKALASGGIRVVRNTHELADWINHYLNDPGLDRAGRKRLIREQCGKLDGRAGERIAREIIFP